MSSRKESILAVERILGIRGKTVPEIQAALLPRYGIERERKAVYSDLRILTEFIPVVIERRGTQWFYNVADFGKEVAI